MRGPTQNRDTRTLTQTAGGQWLPRKCLGLIREAERERFDSVKPDHNVKYVSGGANIYLQIQRLGTATDCGGLKVVLLNS